MADGFAAADKFKPFIGNNSLAKDRGYTKDGLPTATCLCGAVQLAFVSIILGFCTPVGDSTSSTESLTLLS